MNSIVLAASENLRLVFDRRGDRWGHRIELLREGESIAALSSIEGSAEDDWPLSPAFQNVHLQTFSINGQTALLVGKAGSSHWSAAIEADHETGVLRFDIACRSSADPTFLGSSYLIIGEGDPAQLFRSAIEVPLMRDGCQRSLQANEKHLTIRVVQDSAPSPRTIRWKYVVSFRVDNG